MTWKVSKGRKPPTQQQQQFIYRQRDRLTSILFTLYASSRHFTSAAYSIYVLHLRLSVKCTDSQQAQREDTRNEILKGGQAMFYWSKNRNEPQCLKGLETSMRAVA